MIDELPRGWCDAAINEVAEVFLGKTPARTDYASSGSLKVVKFRDIHEGRVDFSNAKDGFVGDNRDALLGLRELRRGDVLITSAAHSGENIGKKCAYVSNLPEPFSRVFFTGELLNIRCPDDTLGRWTYLFFRSADGFSEIQEAVTGVHLTGGRAKQMRIPLAPFNEQRRIVAKLEELLGKVEACQQRLARIPVLLKRFRQSVLAAACSGRLTSDWREDNLKIEPAAETLQAHAKRTAGRGRNTRRMKPAKGLTLLDYSDEFPPTWAWLKVRELVEKGAIFDVQDGNHGELYPRAEDFGDAGMPYISAEHVTNDRVHIASAPRLKHEKAQHLRIGFAKANDVILTHNATVGRVALLPPNSPDVVLSTSTTYYRVDDGVLLAHYLATFLRSHYFQSQLEAVMEQTTRNQVSVTKQVEFGIAVPPLPEQQEIVRRVEALFALADQVETRYAKAKAYVNKLTQSILAKAFRGELVPQDPNDEPASILLERIRQREDPDGRSKRKTKRAALASV